jgi:hypothetical protein
MGTREKLTFKRKNGQLQVIIRPTDPILVERLGVGSFVETMNAKQINRILHNIQNAGGKFEVVGYIAAERFVIIDHDGYVIGAPQSGDILVPESRLTLSTN